MTWHQSIDPANNLIVSAIWASLPVIFLIIALAVLKLKGYVAGILTLVIAMLIAIIIFAMPAELTVFSSLYGILFGLIPVGWIVLMAVFLYNLTVESGEFNIVKDSILTITEDRRIQALLIAFAFGAFLEAIAGFGTPVAITAAMLAGIGFKPFYAAGICLIANTAPVAFAAVGIPIITAGAVSSMDPALIGQMAGRQLALFSVFVPFWLIFIMAGWKATKEVMPAILATGLSYGLVLLLTSHYLGPELPGILSALASIVSLIILLKYWKPETIWKFEGEDIKPHKAFNYNSLQVAKAWSPFIIVTILITNWGLTPVRNMLELATLKISFNTLNRIVLPDGSLLEAVYQLNLLATTGTSIFIATVISAFILGLKPESFFKIFLKTLNELKYALITIACFLGFAYVANWSGMTATLGAVFTIAGPVYPFISPLLGWLGVFITGSDTSSNALFCNLQRVTAEATGVNPVLTVAANTTGGCAAKMISPQSLAVATSSTGLSGQESALFRFTLPHSILFVVFIGLITILMAYVFPWMAPDKSVDALSLNIPEFINGPVILFISFLIIFISGFYLSKVSSGSSKTDS